MAAKFKYCLGGGELVIKDMKAEPSTYYEGELVQAAEAGEAGVTVNRWYISIRYRWCI